MCSRGFAAASLQSPLPLHSSLHVIASSLHNNTHLTRIYLSMDALTTPPGLSLILPDRVVRLILIQGLELYLYVDSTSRAPLLRPFD